MSEVRKRAELVNKSRSESRLDRAKHINDMQSRRYTSQLEVMENNIRKKLKVIENEKNQVAHYLHFLKFSSGVSPFSTPSNSRLDTPKIRPATAGVQRLKFGCDGNANHSYMYSNARYRWGGADEETERRNEARAKSASVSRSRMSTFRTTMSRIRKVEDNLRKRVTWIDKGQGGDDGIAGYSSSIRNYSAKGSLKRPEVKSMGTQCDTEDQTSPIVGTGDDVGDETESVQTNPVKQAPDKKTDKEFKTIHPINVTFPYPVMPDRFRQNDPVIVQLERNNQLATYDRRRGLTSPVAPRTFRKGST